MARANMSSMRVMPSSRDQLQSPLSRAPGSTTVSLLHDGPIALCLARVNMRPPFLSLHKARLQIQPDYRHQYHRLIHTLVCPEYRDLDPPEIAHGLAADTDIVYPHLIAIGRCVLKHLRSAHRSESVWNRSLNSCLCLQLLQHLLCQGHAKIDR